MPKDVDKKEVGVAIDAREEAMLKRLGRFRFRSEKEVEEKKVQSVKKKRKFFDAL